MKKIVQNFWLIAMILSLPTLSFAQWNASFESWSTKTFYSHPTAFHSNIAQSYLVTGSPNVTEVSGQQGSAIRLENVDDGNGGVITGYVSKGPLFFLIGDAESYTGNPSSVTIRCKPQMVGNDSATIHLVFTTATGVPSINTFKFGGNFSTWQEYDFNLSITGVPAEINVVVQSYNETGGSYQVGSAIEVDNIELKGTSEQFENNGFDGWFDVQSEEPHDWVTPNFIIPTLDDPSSDLSVTKVSGGTNGSYAAQIQTVAVPFIVSTLNVGFMGNGTPALFGAQGGFGNHHFAKSANITFDYKYEPQGGDQAMVYARFNDANGDSINGSMETLPASGSYTSYEMTFDWSGIDAPNSLLLYFSSSGNVGNGSGNVGSKLTVDNLNIDGATGIGDPISGYDNGVSVYPNPATEMASIKFVDKFQGTAKLVVYDMLGRVVITDQLVNNEPVIIQLADWNSGHYLYELTTDDKIYTGKFLKQ